MAESGFYEAWIESGLVGAGAAEPVLVGNVYIKAMRTHKITIQALWRIIIPKLMEFLEEQNNKLYNKICCAKKDTEAIIVLSILQEHQYCKTFAESIAKESEKNVNSNSGGRIPKCFQFCFNFSGPERRNFGFAPHVFIYFFTHYDQYNYARWGYYLCQQKCIKGRVCKRRVCCEMLSKLYL
jgi:hypothetical protein